MSGTPNCNSCGPTSFSHYSDKDERKCSNCEQRIFHWKCGACGTILTYQDQRCHNHEVSYYEAPSSSFSPYRS